MSFLVAGAANRAEKTDRVLNDLREWQIDDLKVRKKIELARRGVAMLSAVLLKERWS